MEESLVSIIVPIYKVENYLDECVNSVINQTYKNIEIILVDDGSPDNCPAMCDEWKRRDSRVLVVHKENGGLSDARNAGLDICRGAYIMFLDSDDYLAPQTIKEMVLLLEETNSEICCAGFSKVIRDEIKPIFNERIRDVDVVDGMTQLKQMLLNQVDCSSCCKIYKRSFVGNSRFVKGRNNEDVMFLFELYQNLCKVCRTPNRYYYYRENVGSITHSYNSQAMDLLKNLKDMEKVVKGHNLPIRKEFVFRKNRICLEAAYSIIRHGLASQFPEELQYTQKIVRQNILYYLRSPYFKMRDFIHAMIVYVN